MLPELTEVINEEYDKIDNRAIREKQEVGFIAGLVQKNYMRLMQVSGSNDKRTLFDYAGKALKQTADNFRPPCVGIFYGDPKKVTEAVLLDWIVMKTNPENEYSIYDKHYFYLSDSGRKVVDDYCKFKENL